MIKRLHNKTGFTSALITMVLTFCMLPFCDQAAGAVRVSRPVFSAPAYTSTPMQTGTAHKARVSAPAIYALPDDCDSIYNAGVPIPVFRHDDRNVAFLRGLDTFYSTANVVWYGSLTVDGSPGTLPAPAPQAVMGADGTLTGIFRAEQDRQFSHNLYKQAAPNWYFGADMNIVPDKATTVRLNICKPLSGRAAVVRIGLNSNCVNNGNNSLQIRINGRPAGDAVRWRGTGYRMIEADMAGDVLRDGDNEILLQGDKQSVKLLDFVEIRVPVTPALRDGGLVVQTDSTLQNGKLTLPGMTLAADITAFGGERLLHVQDNTVQGLGPDHLYYLCARVHPLVFGPAITLHEPDLAGRDYLAVAAPGMRASLAPLLTYHNSQGLATASVDSETVIDVFGCGLFSPAGLENLVRRYQPHYLLLAGSTYYDYCYRQGPSEKKRGIPAAYIHAQQLTATDDPYTNGFTTSVGRVPLESSRDMRSWVAKVLAYRPPDIITLYAGRKKKADFGAMMHNCALLLPSMLIGSDNRTDMEVKDDLAAAIAAGATLVAYQGHAQSWKIDNGTITSADAGMFLPATWFFATCNMGYYHRHYDVVLRTFLAAPDRGAVTAIASTSIGAANVQDKILRRAMACIKSNSGVTWGDLMRYLKRNLPMYEADRQRILAGELECEGCDEEQKTIDVFGLFGDPALPVWDINPRTIAVQSPRQRQLVPGTSGPLPLQLAIAGDWRDSSPAAEALDLQYRVSSSRWGPTSLLVPAVAGEHALTWDLAAAGMPESRNLQFRLISRIPDRQVIEWARRSLHYDTSPPTVPRVVIHRRGSNGPSPRVVCSAQSHDTVSRLVACRFQAKDPSAPEKMIDTGFGDRFRYVFTNNEYAGQLVRAKVRDRAGYESAWSEWTAVKVPETAPPGN